MDSGSPKAGPSYRRAMAARVGGSSGMSGLSVSQLRDSIGKLCGAAGHQTQQQKTDFLTQYIGKWSMNQQRMTHQQFMGALQSLHLPLAGAGEVFGALDSDGSGYVEVREFVEAMIARSQTPLQAQPQRQATRNAGSEIVMSGRRASGERSFERVPKIAIPPSESGYSPSQSQAAPKVPMQAQAVAASRVDVPKSGGSSRNGSRTGSANQSPMSTLKLEAPQMAARAAPTRPRPNRPNPTEVDFSDMVISKFRAIVLNRGGSSGIHSLGRIFRIMDDDRNHRISLEELSSGLQDYGLRMGNKDLQLLLAAIDKDDTGSLSFDEFLVSVRGVVNARRQKLISMAFDTLDSTGDGRIMVDDIANCFDAQGHPDVIAGRLPEDEALNHFLSQFDGVDQDGTVTRSEFLEYYRNVSASIDDDDYFELMIRNAWHISGGVGQSRNTANTRVLVVLADGEQKIVSLEHDMGLDLRNAGAVKAQLKAQGIANVVSFSTSGQC